MIWMAVIQNHCHSFVYYCVTRWEGTHVQIKITYVYRWHYFSSRYKLNTDMIIYQRVTVLQNTFKTRKSTLRNV